MWPLTGREIMEVCGGSCEAPSLEELMIGGVTVGGAPEPDELFVALEEGGYDAHDWAADSLRAGAALALVAPTFRGLAELPGELRERCMVVEDPLRALRKLAAFLRRRFPFPVVAVGGSNGKTTTKEMIAALLSGPGFQVTKTPQTMNGFTGLPITIAQRAHATATAPHALVVEIGIDAVGAMAEHAALIDPDVAVLTALGPEHLDGLGSWDVAAAEELLLFEASTRVRRVFQARDPRLLARLPTARQGDVIVCEEDDRRVADALPPARAGVSLLTFRASCPSPFASDVDLGWHPVGAPAWRGRVHVPMAGRHNADNLAAAFGAGLALGRTPRELMAGWPRFTPPGMRCQAREIARDCVLIDDAYNASPPSMAAALALIGSPAFRLRRKVLILGDMLDLGSDAARFHLELCEPLRALPNAHVCLFGDRMREVHRALEGGSASFLPPDAEPCAFLDLPEAGLDGAVVLVKGSRGMKLERVVSEILRRCQREAPEPTVGEAATAKAVDPTPSVGLVGVGVVGSRGGHATVSLLASLLERLAPGRYAVVELTLSALALGLAAGGRIHVGVFTDFEHDPEGRAESPELALALMAQLFMPLPEGGLAVLRGDDPASDLLAEIVPAGLRVVRYEGEGSAVAALSVATALGFSAEAARGAMDVTA